MTREVFHGADPGGLVTESDAYEFLERLRWGSDGPTACPHCKSDKGAWFLKSRDPEGRKSKGGSEAKSQRRVWKCKACRRQFSVLTHTALHATKLPVRVWIGVAAALCDGDSGVSAREVAQQWGVSDKSAWHLIERLCAVAETQEGDAPFVKNTQPTDCPSPDIESKSQVIDLRGAEPSPAPQREPSGRTQATAETSHADAEAQRQREVEAQAVRKRELAAARKRELDAEAQAVRKRELAAARKRELDAEAEAERRRELAKADQLRELEAETKRKRRLVEAKRKRKKEAAEERQRELVEAERQRQLKVDVARALREADELAAAAVPSTSDATAAPSTEVRPKPARRKPSATTKSGSLVTPRGTKRRPDAAKPEQAWGEGWLDSSDSAARASGESVVSANQGNLLDPAASAREFSYGPALGPSWVDDDVEQEPSDVDAEHQLALFERLTADD